MTPERSANAALSSTVVADLLGVSPRTLLRIPKDQLDFWETPGGGVRRHRRYRRDDVVVYARDFLGLELAPPIED